MAADEERLDTVAKSAPHEFRDQLREHLRERKRDGDQYIKAWRIAEHFDVTLQKVGSNMRFLREQGDVGVWGAEGNKTTYTIELEVEDA